MKIDDVTATQTEVELNPIWEWENSGLKDPKKEAFLEKLKTILINNAGKSNNVIKKLTAKEPTNRCIKKPDWSLIKDLIKLHTKDTRESIEVMNVLTHVVRHGEDNELWDFAYDPGFSIFYEQPSPHGTPIDMDKTGRLYQLREVMRGLPTVVTAKQLVGDLFFSAICHSAVCNSDSLLALLISSIQGEIYANDDLVWIPADLAWKGKPNQEFRRVLVDPITVARVQFLSDANSGYLGDDIRALIERLEHSKRLAGDIYSCIQESIRARNSRILPPIKNYSGLITAQLAEMDLRMPSTYSYYANRKTINHSLTEQSWRHLLAVEQDDTVKEKDLEIKLKNSYKQFKEEDAGVLGGVALKSLYRCFSKLPPKHELREKLESWLEKKIPGGKSKKDAPYDRYGIVRLLAQWQIYLIDRKEGRGANARPDSLRQMLYAIAPALVEYVADDDVEKLRTEDWREIFQNVIDTADARSTKIHYTRFLYTFQQFLVEKKITEDFGEEGLMGFQQELVPVDAEIINEDEYQAVLKATDRALARSKYEGLITVMKFMLILGFRTGMRRREALYLKVEDIIGVSEVICFIRPNRIRTLKTTSSERTLPLHCLLAPEELSELKEWIQRRESECRELSEDDEGYLFALPKLQKQSFREREIFDSLHKIIREVTGRINLRFHHLRHSAATWMTARLFLADHPMDLDFLNHLPQTSQTLEKSKIFSDSLYQNSGPTRRHLYYVAYLLGHSGPDVTLEHYIHCMDWLLAKFMGHTGMYDSRDLAQIQALATSTTYDRRRRKVDLNGRSLAQSFPVVRKLKTTPPAYLNRNNIEVDLVPACPDIFDIWDAMRMYAELDTSPKLIYQLTGVEPHDLRRYMAKSQEIATSPPTSRVFRAQSLAKAESGRRYIPRMPRKKDDQKFARRLLSIFNNTERRYVVKFANLYIEQVYKRSEWIEFSHGHQAKEFLELVFSIGFNRWDLKIRRFESKNSFPTAQKKYWLKHMHPFVKTDVEVAQETEKYYRNIHGRVSFRIIDKKWRSSSPGLRFVIMMLVVSGEVKPYQQHQMIG